MGKIACARKICIYIYIYIYTKIKSEIYELHCNSKYKATPVKIAGNSTLKLFNYICLFMLCAPVNVWQSQDNLQESALLPSGFQAWQWAPLPSEQS